MSLHTLLFELWRFFKDYFLKIILGTALVAILATVGGYWLNNKHSEEALDKLTPGEVTQEAVLDAKSNLKTIYSQEPASIRFIVIQEDGNVFDNSFVFDEYFTSSEKAQALKKETGVDIPGFRQAENLLGIVKTNVFRGGLAGIRDRSSDVITLRVLVGQTAEENLRVAQAIADKLKAGDLPFLKGMQVSILEEAQTADFLSGDDAAMVAGPNTLNEYIGQGQRPLVLYAILGVILGFFLSAFILFLWHFSSKKVLYAFDYQWELPMQHLMLNKRAKDFKERLALIEKLPSAPALVLSQENNDLPLGVASSSQCPDQGVTDWVLILAESGKTDKDWLSRQREACSLLGVPVKLVLIY